MPFFKRAQLAAADLHLQGIAPARDLAALTLFADNLVPHVLRIDGVLAFDDALVARIDRGELLAHDAPEEVEIRACAVHAVELLVAAHGATTADGGRQRALAPRRASRATRRTRATARAPRRTDGSADAVAAPQVAERHGRGGVHRRAELRAGRPAVAVGERVRAQRRAEARAPIRLRSTSSRQAPSV